MFLVLLLIPSVVVARGLFFEHFPVTKGRSDELSLLEERLRMWEAREEDKGPGVAQGDRQDQLRALMDIISEDLTRVGTGGRGRVKMNSHYKNSDQILNERAITKKKKEWVGPQLNSLVGDDKQSTKPRRKTGLKIKSEFHDVPNEQHTESTTPPKIIKRKKKKRQNPDMKIKHLDKEKSYMLQNMAFKMFTRLRKKVNQYQFNKVNATRKQDSEEEGGEINLQIFGLKKDQDVGKRITKKKVKKEKLSDPVKHMTGNNHKEDDINDWLDNGDFGRKTDGNTKSDKFNVQMTSAFEGNNPTFYAKGRKTGVRRKYKKGRKSAGNSGKIFLQTAETQNMRKTPFSKARHRITSHELDPIKSNVSTVTRTVPYSQKRVQPLSVPDSTQPTSMPRPNSAEVRRNNGSAAIPEPPKVALRSPSMGTDQMFRLAHSRRKGQHKRRNSNLHIFK